MKYRVNDTLVVYHGLNNFYNEGAVVRVLDHDSNDKAYLVVSLQDEGKANGDLNKVLNNFSQWVREEHCTKVGFEQPWYVKLAQWFKVNFE